MENKKLTNKGALTYILTNCTDIPADVKEKLEAMVAALDKKTASGEKKPTASQIENAKLAEAVTPYLDDEARTLADWAKVVPELAGLSSQKVTAVFKVLVADKVAKYQDVKGRRYYSKA